MPLICCLILSGHLHIFRRNGNGVSLGTGWYFIQNEWYGVNAYCIGYVYRGQFFAKYSGEVSGIHVDGNTIYASGGDYVEIVGITL